MVGNSGTGTSIQISYCDIQGPDENVVHEPGCTVNWGLGNIDVDPLFVDAVGGDYHLLEESPCIDAGDPDFVAVPGETDIDGEPRISGAEIDLGADELVLAIPAEVKITPKTLNPESKGWITCIISLPDNYDIGEVATDSITLNGVRRAKCKTNEKKQTLLVKFDRSKIFDQPEIQSMLSAATESMSMPSLSVRGEISDGTVFQGSDTITILHKDN
jgi:hypothetical protein